MGVRYRRALLRASLLIALVLPVPFAWCGAAPHPGAVTAPAPKTFEATLAQWGMSPRPTRLALGSDNACGAIGSRRSSRGNCAVGTSAPAEVAGSTVSDTVFANGFDNSGGQCLTVTDCPAAECSSATCDAGVCGATSDPSGSLCSSGYCDGNGGCVQCLSADDCPSTGNECFPATCDVGTCGATALPYGSLCSTGFCDGTGDCQQCLSNNDCPTTGNECYPATCDAGTCGATPLPTGAPCSGGMCNGVGDCVECLTDNDCPATGSDCVLAVCATGACGTEFAPVDAPCDSGTGVCDGMGSCQPLQL